MPLKRKEAYERLQPELAATINDHLLRDPHLQRMLDVTMANVTRDLPNLVSFVDSVVDLTAWERVSNVSTPDDDAQGPFVEASLS